MAKAIRVREDQGRYEIEPNATPLDWERDVLNAADGITRARYVERLHGWAPYQWALETDQGWYFVAGKHPPAIPL